jgi:hypothetical protein
MVFPFTVSASAWATKNPTATNITMTTIDAATALFMSVSSF